jgi:hypothetical protein
MSRILRYLPELEGDEQFQVARLMSDLSDDEVAEFAHAFRARRKDPNTVLILTLVGLLGFAGIQRFYLGQIGMGLLYFFTGGLCVIGTIVDALNHKRLAAEHNTKQAREVISYMRGALPAPGATRQLSE